MAYVHPTLNYVVTPADNLQSCPYDKNHHVREARLSRHLVKCRDAYIKQCKEKGKPPNIFVCRWNTSHHISGEFLEEHEQKCKDRESLLQFTLHCSDPNFKIPGPRPAPAVQNMTEDWGQDDEKTKEEAAPDSRRDGNQRADANRRQKSRPGYDPSDRLSREPLIYNPQGLTRSERRQFRECESMRWDEQNLMQCVLNARPSPEASAVPRFSGNPGPRPCHIPGSTIGITVQEPYENSLWDYGLGNVDRQAERERNYDDDDPKRGVNQGKVASN